MLRQKSPAVDCDDFFNTLSHERTWREIREIWYCVNRHTAMIPKFRSALGHGLTSEDGREGIPAPGHDLPRHAEFSCHFDIFARVEMLGNGFHGDFMQRAGRNPGIGQTLAVLLDLADDELVIARHLGSPCSVGRLRKA